jgi:hypothetical protein
LPHGHTPYGTTGETEGCNPPRQRFKHDLAFRGTPGGMSSVTGSASAYRPQARGSVPVVVIVRGFPRGSFPGWMRAGPRRRSSRCSPRG